MSNVKRGKSCSEKMDERFRIFISLQPMVDAAKVSEIRLYSDAQCSDSAEIRPTTGAIYSSSSFANEHNARYAFDSDPDTFWESRNQRDFPFYIEFAIKNGDEGSYSHDVSFINMLLPQGNVDRVSIDIWRRSNRKWRTVLSNVLRSGGHMWFRGISKENNDGFGV